MKTRNIYLIVVLCLFGLSVQAQNLKAGYFVESNHYRNDLNPAFGGSNSYLGLSVLGNMNVGTQSNIALENFIYKTNGNPKYKLTTFMSPTVSNDEFLGKLTDKNKVNLNIGFPIVSFGVATKNGYDTYELNIKSSTRVILPYDLFSFMKTGMDHSSYEMSDMSARSESYAELAYGRSQRINDKLTVGAKAKLLIGLANGEVKFDRLHATLADDKWVVESKGTLTTNVKGSSFKKDDDGGWVKGLDVENGDIGGLGLGLDVGATYKVIDNLTLSAALLDLGFIHWNSRLEAKSDKTFTFDGFNNIAIDDKQSENKIDKQWDRIRDDMEELVHFYEDNTASSSSTNILHATVNIGAEYVLPSYNKLSFGILSSTKFAGKYTSTYAMLSTNIRPLKWIEASLNCTCSTYGTTLGGMLILHPGMFSLFVGSDAFFTRITPQYIPVGRANSNLCIGMNLEF
jgi:hypothetical protein